MKRRTLPRKADKRIFAKGRRMNGRNRAMATRGGYRM